MPVGLQDAKLGGHIPLANEDANLCTQICIFLKYDEHKSTILA
jgi:hypothetical protein